eukprot:122655-Pyramimonas_sp.AAC.2
MRQTTREETGLSVTANHWQVRLLYVELWLLRAGRTCSQAQRRTVLTKSDNVFVLRTSAAGTRTEE